MSNHPANEDERIRAFIAHAMNHPAPPELEGHVMERLRRRRLLFAPLITGTFVVATAAAVAVVALAAHANRVAPPAPATSQNPGVTQVIPSGTATVAPSPSVSQTPAPTGLSAAAVQQAAQKIFVLRTDGSGWYDTCVTAAAGGGASYASCPFTQRLMQRLGQNPIPQEDPVSRAQMSVLKPTITVETTASGAIAHLTAPSEGGSPEYTTGLDFVFISVNGQPLADDILCTGGGASTSIYAASPPNC